MDPNASEKFVLLLVEDERDDIALFQAAIRRLKLRAQVQTAFDGAQAIRYLEGHGIYADRSTYPLPDAIVLDLQLAGMDGLEFLAWHKSSPAFSGLPVITFSGTTKHDYIKSAWVLGSVGVVRKPADPAEWQAAVQKVCELAKSRIGVRGI
jgi:CheY-like chemotaxis protein